MPGGAMIETAFVIVTGPYPAESTTMTSPAGFGAATAAAKLRQGVPSEQVGLSTPDDETNVRWAVAAARFEVASSRMPAHRDRRGCRTTSSSVMMAAPPLGGGAGRILVGRDRAGKPGRDGRPRAAMGPADAEVQAGARGRPVA